MADNHDYIALDWVKGEIESTLNQAQLALEDYVSNQEDTTRLSFCLNYIHQVHGTLQMVEFYGAALLAEEMEQLTRALLKGNLPQMEEAIEVLMRAILQLPNYLNLLQDNKEDQPVILLPVLNDLRASRGADLLSDTSLFTPDLSMLRVSTPPSVVARLNNNKAIGQLRKLRQMYQFSLAGVVREHDLKGNLDYLRKVCERLQALCRDSSFEQLWRLGSAFIEALESNEIDLSSGTKNILRSLDHNIKRMIDENHDILGKSAPEDIVKHILYYLAQSESSSSSVSSIHSDYQLDIALPADSRIKSERQRMSGPDRSAIESVMNALHEELARVKDQLDLFVRSEFKDTSDLSELTPGLQQVANTMAVLGLGMPRRVVEEQIVKIDEIIVQGELPEDDVLMDIAGALLYVEATLGGYGDDSRQEPDSPLTGDVYIMPREQVEDAHEAVIREARNGLEQAKTDIVEYIASQFDKSEIEEVPARLQSIKGGLQIIPLEDVANLLHQCALFISEQLLEKEGKPDWGQLDTLADAITSIEYYLERLSEGSRDNDMVLKVAEESLGQLGYGMDSETGSPIPVVTQQVQVVSDPQISQKKESDKDLIDDDIIEIFAEEAVEVVQTIQQFYPVFQSHPEDAHALTEIRRAYHTLKGSGRLVGATSIGELAWAVENLLNRVIEGSVSPDIKLFEMLEVVNNQLPDLIDSFQQGNTESDVSELITTAENLAATRKQAREASTTQSKRHEDSAKTAVENAESSSVTGQSAIETDNSAEATQSASPHHSSENELIDAEIIEIFVEEAADVLHTLSKFLPDYLSSYDNLEALSEVRRSFHTLKGSGRLVGATIIGELAWSVENLLNRVIDGNIKMSADASTLMEHVVSLLPDLVKDFELQRQPTHDVEAIQSQANALAKGQPVPQLTPDDELPVSSEVIENAAQDNLTQTDSDKITDPVLRDIFKSETLYHLETLEAYINKARLSAGHQEITDDLSRAMHTLKGSANTAGISPIATLAVPAERFIKELRTRSLLADTATINMLDQFGVLIHKGLDGIEASHQTPIKGTEEFLRLLDQLSKAILSEDVAESSNTEKQTDSHLIDLFLTEGVDILLDAERILGDWNANYNHTDEVEKLAEELDSLAGSAATASLPDISELANAMAALYKTAVVTHPTFDRFFEIAGRGHEALINMMDQLAAGLATDKHPALLAEIQRLKADLVQQSSKTSETTINLQEDIPTLEEISETSHQVITGSPFELDPDLAEVFLEEADDLITSAGDTIQLWSEDQNNLDWVRALQRDIHTLKGGARLAGVAPMGNLSQELENVLEAVVEKRLLVTDQTCHLAALAHDALSGMLDSVKASAACEDTPDLIEVLRAYISDPHVAASADMAEEIVDSGTDENFIRETLATSGPELDSAMGEIFLEEAREIIQRSSETLHAWSGDVHNNDHLSQLQRDLHTLKGGARMAEIVPIGDLSHQLETLFESIYEGTLNPSEAIVDIIDEAHDRLAIMVEDLSQNLTIPAASELISRIQKIASEAQRLESDTAEADHKTDSKLSEDIVTSDVINQRYEVDNLDHELVSLFLEEAEDLVHSTANNLQLWLEDLDNIEEVKTLQRTLHTLKGGARLAEIKPVGDLSHELENLFEGIVEERFTVDPSLASLLLQCHDRLAEMIDKVAGGQPIDAANDLILRINHYCDQHGSEISTSVSGPTDTTPAAGRSNTEELREIFLDESRDIMATSTGYFNNWKSSPANSSSARRLAHELSTLMAGAKLANADSVSSLAEALSHRMEAIAESAQQVSAEVVETIGRAVKYLTRLLEQIAELEQPDIPNELINELNRLDSEDSSDLEAWHIEIDPEILQVFVEEATELQGDLENKISDWEKDPRNLVHSEEIARTLHTLKGGARLANLNTIGDLAQEFEAVIKGANNLDAGLNDDLRGEMAPLFSHLKVEIEKVCEFYQRRSAGDQTITEKSTEKSVSDTQTERLLQLQRAASANKAEKQKAETTPAQTVKSQQTGRQAPVENIRVPAPLLDDLVNLAGETSITRGLLEQKISDFTFTLEEMQTTIDRLREQLRRMDMETEAQILFSLEKEGGIEYEDFDPLEMDRYSSIQQLSRALSESTFDLTDLRETMLNKAKDAETLLLQQSRINTELQEGLMKTRMIPFTSIVPRLRRIVRQICGELGKKVEFNVYNPEGELDRNVLERMVAPLEHMLRNAIGHGIELPDQRIKAGKPPVGNIELSVAREGGDVVLTLSDDGAGIDIDAVRKKATKQGLIDSKTATSDHDVLQFIFHAGFSTAKKVTQISGRGVGMDVVSSEIKQLSGRVSIDSRKGRGTRFVIHLPFTVSVNRALMVNTGEDYYAIPLNTIEGIVRVSTYELEEYYKPNAPKFEYAGQSYQLQYLGTLLKSGHYPKLHGQPLPLPVILVRSGGEQPLALQVDSLMGSREIVVKTLGAQFSEVRGVSGATILGDGNVVVILDLPAMLRSDFSATIGKEDDNQQQEKDESSTATKIMVVDDSVTVRKVTSRLLERNGMEVLLAKDGVDAIALLQDNQPDIMLLDIEMPRMDGFEVASLVRHDARLKDVPIIMITSRTGQKHRDRAASIGVNEYLGKPFQEGQLLETIAKLVD